MLRIFVNTSRGCVSYILARQGPSTQELLPQSRAACELLAIEFLHWLHLNEL